MALIRPSDPYRLIVDEVWAISQRIWGHTSLDDCPAIREMYLRGNERVRGVWGDIIDPANWPAWWEPWFCAFYRRELAAILPADMGAELVAAMAAADPVLASQVYVWDETTTAEEDAVLLDAVNRSNLALMKRRIASRGVIRAKEGGEARKVYI